MIFGHPWHGRWTEAGIELPNGTVRPMKHPPRGREAWAGAWPPDITETEPAHGDVLVVKVPGVQAVSTPSTNGLQWLDYALISGAGHSFYDVELGVGGWIYIDDLNKPWLATISNLQAGNVAPRIYFRRIQAFGDVADDVYYINYPAALFTKIPSPVGVLDADFQGRVVLVGYRPLASAGPVAHAPIQIAGIPGIDLSVAYFPLSGGYDNSTFPGGNYDNQVINSYVAGGEFDWLHYAAIFFGPAGGIPIFSGMRVSVGDRINSFSPVITTGSVFIVAGDVRVERIVSITTTWGYRNNSWVRQSLVTIGSVQFQVTYIESVYHFSGDIPSLSLRRRAAKIYEVILYADGLQLSLGILTPGKFTPREQVFTPVEYFAYHPITEELLISDAPVSFV